MKKHPITSSFIVYVVLFVSQTLFSLAHAEPYLAQRAGLKCSACHTNVTGGGMRTATGLGYAASYGANNLSSVFSPQLNDSVAVGGNFRFAGNYVAFPDAEIPPNTPIDPPAEIEDSNSFDVSNGTLYLAFTPADSLLFYLDQQVAPEGGRTREAFVLSRSLLGDHSYLKAGKFFLPYGLRLQDDQAFIRQATGFNFDNSDVGVEVGFEPGPWSINFALSNGTQGAGENNKEKQVSMNVVYVASAYRVGASYSQNTGAGDIEQSLYGMHAGVNLGKFTLLGEVDWKMTDMASNMEIKEQITFVSLNYPLKPSLNLKLAYEFLDPSEDIDENERTRISLLAEHFANQYMQVRGGIRSYDGIPQNSFDNRQNAFVELHFHF